MQINQEHIIQYVDYIKNELWKLLTHPYANINIEYTMYLKLIYIKLLGSSNLDGYSSAYQEPLDDEWLIDSEDSLECSRIKLVMNPTEAHDSHVIMKFPKDGSNIEINN